MQDPCRSMKSVYSQKGKRMSQGFTIRNFDPDVDIPALAGLMAEIEYVDQVGNDPSPEAVQRQLDWRGHDPRQDRWLAEAGGAAVGQAWLFAQSAQRAVVYAAVHPQRRRQGIGRALLEQALRRARKIGAAQIASETEANNEAGNAFLQKMGFAPAGHTRFLRAPATLALPEPEWPQGFRAQAMSGEEDLPLLVQASNRCYADLWGHMENTEPATVAFFEDLLRRRPGYIQYQGAFLVFGPDHSVVGLCPTRLGPEDPQAGGGREKVLDAPGIAPEFRPLPLLRPLALTAMRWLDSQAYGPFLLETWGDPEAAVEVYRQIGFTLEERDHNIAYLLSK